MQISRCGHFTLEVEELVVAKYSGLLRIPIRRCALAEHMIGIIVRTEEGAAVARKLIITDGDGDGSREIDPANVRVAFGPDLEAIHPSECSVQRCQESCTPSYRLMLRQFGFEEDAARETGAGCLELTEQNV